MYSKTFSNQFTLMDKQGLENLSPIHPTSVKNNRIQTNGRISLPYPGQRIADIISGRWSPSILGMPYGWLYAKPASIRPIRKTASDSLTNWIMNPELFGNSLGTSNKIKLPGSNKTTPVRDWPISGKYRKGGPVNSVRQLLLQRAQAEPIYNAGTLKEVTVCTPRPVWQQDLTDRQWNDYFSGKYGKVGTAGAYKRLYAESAYSRMVNKRVPDVPSISSITKLLARIRQKDSYPWSCINTATGAYGKEYQVSGNKTFANNPEKYGFTEIPVNSIRRGDIFQHYDKDTPKHAIMFDSIAPNGSILFHYSNGLSGTTAMRHFVPYFEELTGDTVLTRGQAGLNLMSKVGKSYRYIGQEK